MKLSLNVYGKDKETGKRMIVKTVTSDTVFVLTSTIEDLLDVVDLSTLQVDKLDNDSFLAIGGMIIKAYKQIKPLVLDVFDDLTEEDFRHTSQKEVITVVIAIIKEAFGDLMTAIKAGQGQDSKN